MYINSTYKKISSAKCLNINLIDDKKYKGESRRGGSSALTALVMVNETLFIRKYAIADVAKKIAFQNQWINENRNFLPLVSIVISKNSLDKEGYYFYDMNYSATAKEYYEFIYMDGIDKSLDILKGVLSSISDFHAKTYAGIANYNMVEEYLIKKCIYNIVTPFNFN